MAGWSSSSTVDFKFDDFHSALLNGVVSLTFTKLDGSERPMVATLDPHLTNDVYATSEKMKNAISKEGHHFLQVFELLQTEPFAQVRTIRWKERNGRIRITEWRLITELGGDGEEGVFVPRPYLLSLCCPIVVYLTYELC